MWLWRPRSSTTGCLEAGEPGKPVVWLSLCVEVWEPGARMSEGRRRWTSQVKQREPIYPSFAFLFCLGPQQIRWCPRTLVRAIVLSRLPIQRLISTGHTLTDTPRKNLFTSYLGSLIPVKLTYRINRYRELPAGLVVGIPGFHCWLGSRFGPRSGNWGPASLTGKKKRINHHRGYFAWSPGKRLLFSSKREWATSTGSGG